MLLLNKWHPLHRYVRNDRGDVIIFSFFSFGGAAKYFYSKQGAVNQKKVENTAVEDDMKE